LKGSWFCSRNILIHRLPTHDAQVINAEHNYMFFLNFPIYLQSVYIHSNTISILCVEKRGRVEECSVAPLRDKRVKTLCGCRGKKGTNYGKIQTKTYN
jgi:hypothetical protein